MQSYIQNKTGKKKIGRKKPDEKRIKKGAKKGKRKMNPIPQKKRAKRNKNSAVKKGRKEIKKESVRFLKKRAQKKTR